jgi:hypothetical protein
VGWRPADFRLAVLKAFLATGVAVAVSTEILGRFRAITPAVLAVVWLVFCVLFTAVALWRWRRLVVCPLAAFDSFRQAIRRQWLRLRVPPELGFWVFVAVVFGFLAIVALHAAPNNFDSLTYRLPRVMHWAQNQSAEFFPTQILRQNHRAPFAEWVLLHVFVVVRHDVFFSLVQVIALGVTCVGIHELASRWGLSARGRRLAVVLALTTPMAILQATSTQSDLIASFFFVAFLVFGLRMSDRVGGKFSDAVFCGCALGLGLLTRTPLLLFCGVFAVWFGFRGLVGLGLPALGRGAVVGAVAVVLLGGHSLRNVALFGGPLSPGGSEPSRARVGNVEPSDFIAERCETMTIPFFVSNVIRNSAMHLQSPIPNVNKALEQVVWDVHRAMGMTPHEPEITWPASRFEPSYLRHEDIAGNPVQALLFVAALGAIGWRGRVVSSEVWTTGFLLLAAFLSLSVVLKWQPWHPRIELPLFLVACPFAAAVFDFRGGRFALMIATAAVVYAVPFCIDNHKRPVFGPKSVFALPRTAQFFDGDFATAGEYMHVAGRIKGGGFRFVGIRNDVDSLQYPLWSILREKTKRRVRFCEVNVTNVSSSLAAEGVPEMVVATYPESADILSVGGESYRATWRGSRLVVYEPVAR